MIRTEEKNIPISIALDVMGGDHAPDEIIEGAIEACKESQSLNVFLVGNHEKISSYLKTIKRKKKNEEFLSQLNIEPADEIIEMHEPGAKAVKNKKNSSIVKGFELVKEKKAGAFISAGNTGAVMAAALIKLGRIKGIDRPAIAVTLPTAEKPIVLIDAGANAECKPSNLVQFAMMGSAFYEKALGVRNPSVGLLNIGAEKGKGGELVKLTHDLLEESDLNFYGNIEGRDVSKGTTDIVVCDGFIGNIVLKTMEGMASVMFAELKKIIKATTVNKVGGIILSSPLKKLQKRLNQDTYGGAHLLGVNGICIISHGSAKRTAIKNALLVAKTDIEHQVIEKIKVEAHK